MSARERLYASLGGGASGDEGEREQSLASLHERLRGLAFGNAGADVERFLLRAQEAGTQVFRVATLADVGPFISRHVGGGKTCILSADALFERLGMREVLHAQGCTLRDVREEELAAGNPEARRKYAAADVGITVAEAGLADSGAILISSSENESRSVSLLPVEHIALLPADRIVASLLQTVGLLRTHTGREGTSAVTIVGGPSKTADIEKVLVTGVHGPATLTIVVIDNAE